MIFNGNQFCRQFVILIIYNWEEKLIFIDWLFLKYFYLNKKLLLLSRKFVYEINKIHWNK